MDDERLSRIEDKQDAILATLNEVVKEHSNRLTKLEAEAGYIKAGFAFCLALFMGAVGWAFNKVFK